MKSFVDIFRSAITAGLFIALGGFVFLKVGGIVGACLFTFGLLGVIHYQVHLFTGRSGYVNGVEDFFLLFTAVLFGNVLGCYLVSLLVTETAMVEAASALVATRVSSGLLTNFLLAIPCGFIMTTCVEFGREDKFLPTLFGIPLFIMCGFRHCIADAIYLCVNGGYSTELFYIWGVIVLGNFIGCNLFRLINYESVV